MRSVAGRCGVAGADDEELSAGLKAWQRHRTTTLKELDQQRTEWSRLQALLGDGSLEDLAVRTARYVAEAARLRGETTDEELGPLLEHKIEDTQVEQARTVHSGLAKRAATLNGQVELRARQLPSVAEAEDALGDAQRELERVRRLEETLNLTREFLQRAEERVHRDVTQVLVDTIRPWLPSVTANRYTELVVDPDSLSVKVRGAGNGELREAMLLSHGTAEQIYLLLRLALAKHLTKPGETCPLILDDVTVQCDSIRKPAVLQLLHAISRERQVILFSQEDAVLAWGEANLTEPQDRLVRLDIAGIEPQAEDVGTH